MKKWKKRAKYAKAQYHNAAALVAVQGMALLKCREVLEWMRSQRDTEGKLAFTWNGDDEEALQLVLKAVNMPVREQQDTLPSWDMLEANIASLDYAITRAVNFLRNNDVKAAEGVLNLALTIVLPRKV